MVFARAIMAISKLKTPVYFLFLSACVALFLFAFPNGTVGREFRESDFMWDVDSQGRKTALALDNNEIRYNIVGDQSGVNIALVERYLQLISKITNKRIQRYGDKLSLVMIYDKKAFERIKNKPEDYDYIGVPRDVIAKWGKDLNPETPCFTQIWPENGSIVASTVVSVDNGLYCVIIPLFRSFGVVADGNDFASFLNVCILYKAKVMDKLDIREFSKFYGSLARDCEYSLMNMR